MADVRISGFTIVRNATILDYPFQESVRSLLKFCDEVVINCGDSDDDTLALCEALELGAGGKIRLLSFGVEPGKSAGRISTQMPERCRACRVPRTLVRLSPSGRSDA